MRLLHRNTDGYPIGSDAIMRDAYGKIPSETQAFWSLAGWQLPDAVMGWQYDAYYHQWRALVRFASLEIWTSPQDLQAA